MSYPAACRAYERCTEELRKLVEALQQQGVDVEALLHEIEQDNHKAAMDLITENESFRSLTSAALNWQGSYENMKEEEEEWYQDIGGYTYGEDSDTGKMYGGISDDWEEYLDMIGHEQNND
jgi:hypothetical protein